MIWSRFLLVTLAVLLALPVPLTASAPQPEPFAGSRTGQAAAATASGTTVGDAPHLKAGKARKKKSAKRKKQNQQRRAEAREARRQGNTAKDERARIRAEAASAPPKAVLAEPGADLCGPGMIYLPESGHCTHGPDPAPPGTDISEPVELVPAAAARRAATAVACDGDGVSGYRVQVLYVRSSSAADQYDAYLPSIRAWAAGADAILRESSSAIGEELGFRFVMTGDCDIDVRHVTVSPTDITNFGRTIDSLEGQGYNRTDRIYLMFADTTAAGICGVGTLWLDDRDTPANLNNSGSSFSRVDRSYGCWNATTAAHELMHNLGGVQYSAPHTSGGGHCIDEYDVMCYSDTPYRPAMTVVCTPQQTFESRFDCGYDDYFHPSPAPGSYLDTHWNTADSRFLIGGTTTSDTTPPAVTWLSPVSNGGTLRAATGTIPLTAAADDPSGVDRVEFWRYSEVRDGWVFIAEDVTAPYTASIAVSALDPGMNYLTADGYDTHGNWIEEPIWVERTAAPPPPPPPPPPPDAENPAAAAVSITSPGSGARVKARKWVTLGVTVADVPSGGLTIEYRVCPGRACAWEAGRSLATVSDPPFSSRWKAPKKGTFTFLAQVTDGAGTSVSAPVTVSVKQEKGKKKR